MDKMFKDQYPGFTIKCDKCGSEEVYIDNSMGYSAVSGQYGTVDLVCNKCNNRIEIIG